VSTSEFLGVLSVFAHFVWGAFHFLQDLLCFEEYGMSFQGSDLALHIEAYKEAGDRLVESISRDRSFQRELILPISSIYRLYLELSLKQLNFLGNQLLAKPLDWKDKNSRIAGFPTIHNIDDLSAKCKEILTQLEVESTVQILSDLRFDVLEKCIRDFYSMDLTVDPFRYPNNQGGKPFLPDKYYVNVYQLKETISRVDVLFFDEALLALSDILQQQR
jgi:hypothetical protein